MFSKIFWKIKIRPIIEYGVVIWSCSLSKNKFKEIQECQVDYIRETHRYGSKSCITAMMMDMSVIEIGIRIGSIREKYSLKCLIRKVPRRIVRYYEGRDRLPTYSKKIQRSDIIPTGYVNVEVFKGITKYRSSVRFSGKKKPMYFYSNYARDAEEKRISWINKNMKLWYKHKKPSETIFRYDKFYKEIKSFKVVSLSEIEDWKVRLDGDKDKIWKYIKKIMKIRIKNLQESQ